MDSGGLHLFSLFACALSMLCNKPDQGGTCNVIRGITGLTRHSGGFLYYVQVQTRICFVCVTFNISKGYQE